MNGNLGPPQILFTHDDLPPKEIQDCYDALMVTALVNGNLICQTLVDNGSGLNICSMDKLKPIFQISNLTVILFMALIMFLRKLSAQSPYLSK